MPIYEYKGINDCGKKTKGVVDADSLARAKEKLKELRTIPLSLSQVNAQSKHVQLAPPLLLSFTRELAQLLKAGLPLYECLLTIEEKYRKTKEHPLFLSLCDAVKNGRSLSFALKSYPKTFDPIYQSMVQSAEASGALAQVFIELTQLLGKQQKLRKKLVSALTYPAFLAIFCVILTLGLLLFVIPTLEELFEDRRLHPLTESVLAMSRFVRNHGIKCLLTLVGASALTALLAKKKQGMARLKELFQKIPLLKTLSTSAALVRLFRTTSLLLRSGVPLLRAIHLSQNVIKHRGIEALLIRAQEKIAEGESLSEQLVHPTLVPPMVPRMLAIAEETGNMATMMQSIADIYEEELEKHLSQLTSLLQPALLLFLGFVVGVVLLSILLPLTDVTSFLG